MKAAESQDDLLKEVLGGDPFSVPRVISVLENESLGARENLSSVFPYTGRVHRVGMADPPGAGKSTISKKGLTFAAPRTNELALSPLIVLSIHESSTFETTAGAQWFAVGCR